MTPEEAKTKWCPMARVANIISDPESHNSGAYNRIQGGDDCLSIYSYCIADACMAWKTLRTFDKDGMLTDNGSGYCGAFGKDSAP